MKKEATPNLDALDQKILKMIMENARTPFLEVARECGVSGAAIHQRVARLTSLGVISGSHFVVSPEVLGYDTCAFMGIYLEKASNLKAVADALKNIPEVVECHYTTGQWAIFVKIRTKTNKDLKRLIDHDLQIDGIARTETLISLEEGFVRQVSVEGTANNA
ncbi:MAG: Lrp/AsnC ligand binding domain-containing protein [Mangrovibacterium sp.]